MIQFSIIGQELKDEFPVSSSSWMFLSWLPNCPSQNQCRQLGLPQNQDIWTCQKKPSYLKINMLADNVAFQSSRMNVYFSLSFFLPCAPLLFSKVIVIHFRVSLANFFYVCFCFIFSLSLSVVSALYSMSLSSLSTLLLLTLCSPTCGSSFTMSSFCFYSLGHALCAFLPLSSSTYLSLSLCDPSTSCWLDVSCFSDSELLCDVSSPFLAFLFSTFSFCPSWAIFSLSSFVCLNVSLLFVIVYLSINFCLFVFLLCFSPLC